VRKNGAEAIVAVMRIKAVNSDKATGQLQHAGRQKQG
jgi:hypothetical protein